MFSSGYPLPCRAKNDIKINLKNFMFSTNLNESSRDFLGFQDMAVLMLVCQIRLIEPRVLYKKIVFGNP